MWYAFNTVLLLFVSLTHVVLGQEIIFGGILDASPEEENSAVLTNEQAFNIAIKYANTRDTIIESGFQYKGITQETSTGPTSPFQAKLATCTLLDANALVIFGPKHQEDINIVHSICDYKAIAHVITRWSYNPTTERNLINFYPHSSYLIDAYFSYLQLVGWKSFTLFYDDNESILKSGELINIAKIAGIIVTIKQLDEKEDGVYRTTLKEAVHSGEKNYIIDCKIEILQEVLRQAQQIGLLTNQYNIFITNLDLHTIDLEPFQYSETNLTGMRLLDPTSEIAQTVTTFIQQDYPDFNIEQLKTETALLFDAVQILSDVTSTKLVFRDVEPENIGCNSLKSSPYGYTISNLVKTSKSIQTTGLIEFDRNGFRSNFNLDFIQIKDNGVNKIGTWNSSKGLITVQEEKQVVNEDSLDLRNRTFKVITCLTDPFCMLKEESAKLSGNARFEGYAIDLIKELANMEGFNYTFIIREDKSNGKKDAKTGQWSGMIGDVINGVADLAITDLTITAAREDAVDFTSPFMNLGISILAQKPKNAPPSFFSFADPFALDTWIMLGLAYAFASLSFFILGRLCQEEWTNPYPCIEEPEFLINQFSLSNSAWFAMGALMQQGTEIAPIAISTRMVSGMWWFFVLIMVSSYTANLAAFLATENTVSLFTDVNSLVANREKYDIKIGAKAKGATAEFFENKDNPTYQAIAKYMEEHPENMVSENRFGVKKAEEENYAFFMESSSIEYEVQRHCDLQQYGKTLDDKGYGIAMRKNSTYRTKLSTAILTLQSSGKLDDLKRTWWEEKRGGGVCSGGEEDDTTPAMGVQNVQGVFYVTIGGTILAILYVIAEMFLTIYKISKKANISFKEAYRIEMHSYLNFNSDVKPTTRAKSKSGSKSSKETEASNNHLQPTPYGFIPTITKEELKD